MALCHLEHQRNPTHGLSFYNEIAANLEVPQDYITALTGERIDKVA